jgi:hypothetical protein
VGQVTRTPGKVAVYTRTNPAMKRETNDRVLPMILEAGRGELSAPPQASSGLEDAENAGSRAAENYVDGCLLTFSTLRL